MSAFNNTRFNLSKYNIQSAKQVNLKAFCKSSFGFSFAGQTFFCRGNAREQFSHGDIFLDKGRGMHCSMTESFSNQIAVNCNFYFVIGYYENFVSVINMSQVANIVENCSEEFDSDLILSQIANLNVKGQNRFDVEKINLGQIANVSTDFGEVFFPIVDVISLIEYTCELSGLVLAPGDELIIDSGSYTVFLNGVPAIHYQKGDWFDNLTRDTHNITITATNIRRLSGEILYTERYL